MAIVLRTLSDSRQAQKDLAKLRESVDKIQTSADNVTERFSSMTKALAVGLAAVSGARAYTQISDNLTNMQNKLKTISSSQNEFNYAWRQTKMVAASTRTELASTVTLYGRLRLATRDLGTSQKDVVRYTELVSKAIATSGATAQESRAAIQQLGQALGRGKFSGDELKSVMENSLALANDIAKGLGLSVGKMQALGYEGKIVTKDVLGALSKQADEIDKRFASMGVTYSAAFTNLRGSMLALFDSVRKSMLGTTEGFAARINRLALSIYDIANNFEFIMLRLKIKMLLLISDVIMVFTTIKSSAKDAAANVLAVFSGFTIKDFLPNLSDLPHIIAEWFKQGFAWASEMTMKFVNKIADAFRWLADILVGHSIVPDMIKKIISWFKMLLKVPVAVVKSFSKLIGESFSSMRIVLPLAAGLAMLTKYRLTLLKIFGLTGLIAMVWKGIKMHKSGELKIIPPKVEEKLDSARDKLKQNKQLNSALDRVTRALDSIKYSEEAQDVRSAVRTSEAGKRLIGDDKENWGGHTKNPKGILGTANAQLAKLDRSTFARVVRQVFGFPEKYEGELFGRKQDTKSYVGLGPQQYQKQRFPGHDIVNAMPVDWQLPFITAFAGAIGLGIVAATKAGFVRNALLVAIGGAWLTATVKTMKTDDIQESIFKAVHKGFSGISAGVNRLYGESIGTKGATKPYSVEGILLDIKSEMVRSVGLLGTIAGLSLLFKPGRAAVGGALTSTILAPTEMSIMAQRGIEYAVTKRQADLNEATLRQYGIELDKAIKFQTNKYEEAIRPVTEKFVGSATIKDNREIIKREIEGRIAERQPTINIDEDLKKAIGVKETLDTLERRKKDDPDARKLESVAKKAKSHSDELKKTMDDAANQFANSIRRSFAVGGGILGATVAFQFGTNIAKGMAKDTPSWQKVGIVIGSTMAGQAVGSAIGVAIGTAVAAILTAKVLLLAIGAGIGIAAGTWIYNTLLEKFPRGAEFVQNTVGKAVEANEQGGIYAVPVLGLAKGLTEATLIHFQEPLEAFDKKLEETGDKLSKAFLKFAIISKAEASDLGKPNLDNEDIRKGPSRRYRNSAENRNIDIVEAMKQGNWTDVAKALGDAFKKAINDMFPNMLPSKGNLGIGSGVADAAAADATIDKNTRLYKLEHGAETGVYEDIVKLAQAAGVQGIKSEHIAELDSAMLRNIAETMDAQTKLEMRAEQTGSKFLQREAAGTRKELEARVKTAIGEAQAAGKPGLSEVTGAGEAVEFADALDHLNSILPKVALGLNEIRKIPSVILDPMIKSSEALYKREQDLLTSGIPVAKLQEEMLGIQQEREKLEQQYIKQLAAFRGPMANFKGTLDELGIDVNLEGLRALDGLDAAKLQQKLQLFQKYTEQADDATTRPEDRISAARFKNRLLVDIQKDIERNALDSIDTAGARLREGLAEFGITLESASYNLMKGVDRAVIADYLKNLQAQQDAITAAGDLATREMQERYDATVVEVERAILRKSYDYRASAENAGNVLASDMGEGIRSGLKSLLKGDYLEDPKRFILDFTERMADAIIDSFVEGLAENFNFGIESFGKQIGENVFGLGRSLIKGPSIPAGLAKNEPLAGSLVSSVAPTITDTLLSSRTPTIEPGTGPLDPSKAGSAVTGTLEAISSGVNITAAATGKIGNAIPNIAGGVVDTVAQSVAQTTATTGIIGAIGAAASMIVGAITASAATSAAAGATGSLAGGFKMAASGGLIRGPGSMTSDSIPAMLSNGEFVVSAQAAKENLQLLTAINDGRVRKLAEGGMATYRSLLAPPPAASSVRNSSTRMSNQQVINLNITGDISRQTKSEIVRMLPMIAEGVNGHNKERGYRNQAF